MPTRSGAFGLALLLAGTLSACETLPPLPEASARERFGRMRVEAAPEAPRAALATFAKGAAEGAAKGGVGGGLIAALDVTLATEAAGASAAGAAAFTVPLLVVTTAVASAVAGAYTAIPKDLARDVEDAVAKALGAAELNARLAAAVEREAAKRPAAQRHGLARALPDADTRLELQVVEAGFQGWGKDPPLRFYMNARARVLGADDAVLYQRDFLHLGAPQHWAAWSADRAAALGPAFDGAIDDLAARMLDELFVITRFPFPSGMWAFPGTPEYGSRWLMPIDPPLQIRLPPVTIILTPRAQEDAAHKMLRYPKVDGLTPTLRWEAFPRPRDRAEQTEALIARIDAVTYDLKVWEAKDGYPQRLVYDRSDLPAPEHRLEQPLAPERDYFWTFRARYRLDGVPQATRWAFSMVPSFPAGEHGTGGYCDLDVIPATNHYRFTTRR